jgi:hypothetical protein
MAVIAVLLLGATRPSFVIDIVAREPVIGWAVVGLVGPLVSAGFIDRLPVKSAVDAFGRGGKRLANLGELVDQVRSKPVERIVYDLYEEQEARAEIARDELRVRARVLHFDELVHFDDYARQVRRFAEESKRSIPREVSAILDRRKNWPTEADPGRDTLVLVDLLIEIDWVRPVSIVCRVGEDRRSRQTIQQFKSR